MFHLVGLFCLCVQALKALLENVVGKLELFEGKVQGQFDSQEKRLIEAERKIENIFMSQDGKVKQKQRFQRSAPPLKSPKAKSRILEMESSRKANSRSVQIEFRSCHEIFLAHEGGVISTLTNNNREKFNAFIDPDGKGIGDPPIFVECDMANNGKLKMNGDFILRNSPTQFCMSLSTQERPKLQLKY